MAKVGFFFFERGNGDSPLTYTRVCETSEIPEFGKTNALVKSTTFCDEGNEAYVPGTADGMELNFVMNREAASAVQQLLIDDVENKVTGQYQVVEELDGSPAYAFQFDAAALHWGIVPSKDDVNKFNFGCKISGAITKATV